MREGEKVQVKFGYWVPSVAVALFLTVHVNPNPAYIHIELHHRRNRRNPHLTAPLSCPFPAATDSVHHKMNKKKGFIINSLRECVTHSSLTLINHARG